MEYQLINQPNPSYPIVTQILLNRGMSLSDIEHYLHTTDDDILPPELIDNIKEACLTILKHLNDDKKILLQVDSDCDGYVSSAELMNYLFIEFPSIVKSKFIYVFHDGKQHGIDIEAVDDSFGLVIAPDSSRLYCS